MADLALRIASNAAVALLAPVLVRQGRRVRRTTPRLPEAAGPCTGEVPGRGAPVRLLVLGESTAAGVGAADHGEGLGGQVAARLAEETGRPVHWRVLGRTGATAATVREELLAPAEGVAADVAVVALGVNDTLRLRAPGAWTRDLRLLVDEVRARCGAVPVVLAGVPPMGVFPALPQPLRGVLGLRATVLDRAAGRLAAEMEGVRHVTVPVPTGPVDGFFCGDRFHPSPHGYAQWGAALGGAAAAALGGWPAARAGAPGCRLAPRRRGGEEARRRGGEEARRRGARDAGRGETGAIEIAATTSHCRPPPTPRTSWCAGAGVALSRRQKAPRRIRRGAVAHPAGPRPIATAARAVRP